MLACGLEFPILSLNRVRGNVAWRLSSDLRCLAHDRPPARPASPGRHSREALQTRDAARSPRKPGRTPAATSGREARGAELCLGLRRGPERDDEHEVTHSRRDQSTSKAVEGHHFGPCINHVTHKLISCVVSCINFCDSAQLGVRPEDKVNGSGRPFELARRPITTLVNAL